MRDAKNPFAADCVDVAFPDAKQYYDHYTWNEGVARAARHYLNEMGACGTCGDINAMGFRQILSAYYVWNYFGLEYEIFQSPYIVDPSNLGSGWQGFSHILS